MHPLLVKYVTYPIRDFVQGLRGYKTEKYHKELMKSQWFTTSQFEEIQQTKLRVLLEHAYKNVPYYTKLFDKLKLKPSNIKDIEDINKLPLLKKEDIRKNSSALVAKNVPEKELKPISSSGTTGPPLKLFVDKNRVAWRTAARHRYLNVSGYTPGDKMITIYGYSFPLKYMFQGSFLKIVRNEWIPYGYDMGEEKIGDLARKIEKYKPDFIKAWPSSIYLLAEYARNNDINLNPRNIHVHGELLYEFQKKLMEEQFNCEIFDVFGLRESSVFSVECQMHAGYHLDAENGIIEIIRDGDHVSEGELGATVFTDFTNFATPLIRYVSEDIVEYSGKTCPCGRGLPLIVKSVEGRFRDCLSTTDNGFVLPKAVVDLFSNLKTIKNFQVIQKTAERIFVKVVRKPNFSTNDADFIINGIQKLVGSDININIKFVDSIPLTASGKKRFVISETSPKFLSVNTDYNPDERL
jgi:phenylacetate-CoA ligase